MGLFQIGGWLWRVSRWVVRWAVTRPIKSMLVGGTLSLSSRWLERQPWAGAKPLATMVGLVGAGLFGLGMGSWIAGGVGRKIMGTARVSIRNVAAGTVSKKAWIKFLGYGSPVGIWFLQ